MDDGTWQSPKTGSEEGEQNLTSSTWFLPVAPPVAPFPSLYELSQGSQQKQAWSLLPPTATSLHCLLHGRGLGPMRGNTETQ